jgi:thiamine kinase-like enzyme
LTYTFAVTEATHDEGLIHRALDTIPALAGSARSLERLPGGLTNRNYKISTTAGCYVGRVFGQSADLLAIDRQHEYENSVRAAAAGVGAPVVAFRPELGVLIVDFLPGVTFTAESFGAPGVLARVAEACAQLHRGPRFVNDFNMFDIQREYLRLVCERGYRLPAEYLDFAPQVDRIERALQVRAEPTVPCNNDLLAGNFIDDGRRIWLIDYEYSGNNDACFELGNLWSESSLSDEQLTELLTCYYGRPLRNKLARARLQALMSQYGWTLWASIQQSASELDFDFWTWGMQKYDAAVRTFRDPGFETLLSEVTRTD